MSLKKLADRQLYRKSFQILKRQFQVHLWFQDKRTTGSVCAGQQISRLSTNTRFMQYGSEPPLDKWKAGGDVTKSSCFSPSLLVTSTTRAAVAARGALLHSQSALPAGFWRGLAAQSSPCLSHLCCLLLDIFQTPQPGSYCLVNFRGPAYIFNHKREHSQAPRLSLVKPGQHQFSLLQTGETENWPICYKESWKDDNSWFSIQDLKSSQHFLTAVWRPGKKKKKGLVQAPLGRSHPHTWATTSQHRDAPAGPKGRHMPAGILSTPWHNTPSSWCSSWGGFP